MHTVNKLLTRIGVSPRARMTPQMIVRTITHICQKWDNSVQLGQRSQIINTFRKSLGQKLGQARGLFQDLDVPCDLSCSCLLAGCISTQGNEFQRLTLSILIDILTYI